MRHSSPSSLSMGLFIQQFKKFNIKVNSPSLIFKFVFLYQRDYISINTHLSINWDLKYQDNNYVDIADEMFSKFKDALTKTQQQKEPQTVIKKVETPVLFTDDIKKYRDILNKFKSDVDLIQELAHNNRKQIEEYIQNRAKDVAANGEASEKEQDQKFTFQDDIEQIKQNLESIAEQLKKIIAYDQQIVTKVNQINQANGIGGSNKNSQELITKYEFEIASLKKSQENNKEILNTLGQQTQLYAKQMKQLQQKSLKLQRELNDKNMLVNNLKEQKLVLLEMRNSNTNDQLPEVQGLKTKLSQFQKRLNLERSKVEAKQKQIQGLRKKMQEDHQSLEKIADQLKEKQLKSKKIIDKYERSKTEIRKFREQKTQFIKQLNMEVAKMSDELAQQKKKNQQLKDEVFKLKQEIQNLKSEVSKNENRKIELESSKSELVQVRKELHDKNLQFQEQSEKIKKMKQANDQLQQKRKQLLEALQKPINHEIRTLEKILKALDKLYKDYITTVFQEGNVVGFEAKITYIISNVQQIKEDLLL